MNKKNIKSKHLFLIISFAVILGLITLGVIGINTAFAFEDTKYKQTDEFKEWQSYDNKVMPYSNDNNVIIHKEKKQSSNDFRNLHFAVNSNNAWFMDSLSLEIEDREFDKNFEYTPDANPCYVVESNWIYIFNYNNPGPYVSLYADYIIGTGVAECNRFVEWEINGQATTNGAPVQITGDLNISPVIEGAAALFGYVCDNDSIGFLGADVVFHSELDGKDYSAIASITGSYYIDRIPLESTGKLVATYNLGGGDYFSDEIIISSPLLEAKVYEQDTMYLEKATSIRGIILDENRKSVENAKITFYDDAVSHKSYKTTSEKFFTTTIYKVIVPIGASGKLEVESPDYIKSSINIVQPLTSTGLDLDITLYGGIKIDFKQVDHANILCNDELKSSVTVPAKSSVELVSDEYGDYIYIWDPNQRQEGVEPYYIISCDIDSAYKFIEYTFNPEPKKGVLQGNTTVSLLIEAKPEYVLTYSGTVNDKFGDPIPKTYITYYEEATGINHTTVTGPEGNFEMSLKKGAKGLVLITAENYETTLSYLNVGPDTFEYSENFVLNLGYDAIFIGRKGHSTFVCDIFCNNDKIGNSITLGNPEHLGLAQGSNLVLLDDNILKYSTEKDNDLITAYVKPLASETYKFDRWIIQEMTKALLPGENVIVNQDISLGAYYLGKDAEDEFWPFNANGSAQTSDYVFLIVFSILLITLTYFFTIKSLRLRNFRGKF